MLKRKILVAGAGLVMIAGSVTLGATAFAGSSTQTTSILKACVNNKDGAMRLVSASASTCPVGQRLVKWNVTGPAGPKGARGATGPQGAPGPEGLTGPQGATGPQGGTGPQGATGPDGAPGRSGTRIVTGVGEPSQELIDAAQEGDIFISTATDGAVTLQVFDGDAYGSPTSLEASTDAVPDGQISFTEYQANAYEPGLYRYRVELAGFPANTLLAVSISPDDQGSLIMTKPDGTARRYEDGACSSEPRTYTVRGQGFTAPAPATAPDPVAAGVCD